MMKQSEARAAPSVKVRLCWRAACPDGQSFAHTGRPKTLSRVTHPGER
jgi:hypothetical protein